MTSNGIANAVLRLRVLAIDTIAEEHRIHRRLTHQETIDLTAVLDELHRLHVAVSSQRGKLEAIAQRRAKRGTKEGKR